MIQRPAMCDRETAPLEVDMEAYASWLDQQREEPIVPPEADL
jgi:hypothetical protein